MDITNWAFGSDGPQWPVDAQGQKERAVRLMDSFDSAADADMTISLLAAYGIPCFKYYDLDGGAGKVINGFSGYGAGLYVPASMEQEARALLEAEPITDENE
ncbi:MAG: hypothetical protein KBS74_03930 [Clostridiales bacterium]|nr:hypothetical protein [Candidatus Cacconaster stercorequi]